MATIMSNVDIVIDLVIESILVKSVVTRKANQITLQRKAGPMSISTVLKIRIIKTRITIPYSTAETAETAETAVTSPILQNIKLFRSNMHLIHTYGQSIHLAIFILLHSKTAFSIIEVTPSRIVWKDSKGNSVMFWASDLSN